MPRKLVDLAKYQPQCREKARMSLFQVIVAKNLASCIMGRKLKIGFQEVWHRIHQQEPQLG